MSFVHVVVLGIEILNIWMGEVDWRFQIFCFCFLFLFLFCLNILRQFDDGLFRVVLDLSA